MTDLKLIETTPEYAGQLWQFRKEVFEHDPDEMFSATITTNMQNRILAKGIPALSIPTGNCPFLPIDASRHFNMNSLTQNAWCRNHPENHSRWLHTDIQNTAFFFTYGVFERIVDKGGLNGN